MKTKIQELYDNPKSKGFVNHLIRSYLPIGKVEKIWDWKKGQSKKCNVCGQKLFAIEDAFQAVQNKDFMSNFMEALKKDVNGEMVKREDNPYVKAIGKDKVQGLTGKNTDTCMCTQCVQDLLDLTQTGVLMGDKNLNYQVNQMRRDQVFDQFDESPAIDDEAKKELKDIKKRVDKDRGITTFGDLQALQDLKKKMENGND